MMAGHPPNSPMHRDSWHEPDPTSWEFWLSSFESSLHGDAWKETGRWALEILRAQLGEQWLGRTLEKYEKVGAESALPTFFVLAPAHTIAFAQLLELTLRLDLLGDRPGMGRIRKDLLKDPREEQLMHLRLQLEVGALSLMANHDVHFERPSRRKSWPADVIVEIGEDAVAIETAVILLDEPTREHENATDRLFELLRHVEIRHDVQIAGDFDRKLEDSEIGRLVREVEIKALEVRLDGVTRSVDSLRASLTLTRAGTLPRPGRSDPIRSSLLWQRTERILRRKAEQCIQAASVWLRVDAQDGLWQFTQWASMKLPQKLAALIGPVRRALEPYPHIKGLVLTSGATRAQGGFRTNRSQHRTTASRYGDWSNRYVCGKRSSSPRIKNGFVRPRCCVTSTTRNHHGWTGRSNATVFLQWRVSLRPLIRSALSLLLCAPSSDLFTPGTEFHPGPDYLVARRLGLLPVPLGSDATRFFVRPTARYRTYVHTDRASFL